MKLTSELILQIMISFTYFFAGTPPTIVYGGTS